MYIADPELSRFIVANRLNEFRGARGIRIKDDVIVHQNGTKLISIVPRIVEEIESWMAGDNSFLTQKH